MLALQPRYSNYTLSSGILLKTKEVGVKQFLAAMFLFISFGATAECWVVGDMRGISYSERNNFHPEEAAGKAKIRAPRGGILPGE